MNTLKAHLLLVVFITITANLFSQTAEEWKKLGNAELDSANYIKAIEFYQKAIETDTNYFDAYFNIGLAYSYLLEFDKAIEYYNKGITKNDTDSDAFFAVGFAYMEKNDYDKAIEMLKKGISLKPDSPEEHFYLGFLYQEKGNYTYAEMYAKKAAQLGDTLAQQTFLSNGLSWEDSFLQPDYEQIKKNIEDNQSEFYYPLIWEKYQQGDSTMTLEESRHLYYGYVFHKSYSPYLTAPNWEQINNILNKDEPTIDEWEELASLLNVSLSVEPFSCRYLYYQSIAYNALNKLEEADKNLWKIGCIIDAFLSTGDGLLKETAIHVISVSNEYDYLFMNDFSMNSQALVHGGYDVLYLNPNEFGLEEMWFDVNQPLNRLNSTFDE